MTDDALTAKLTGCAAHDSFVQLAALLFNTADQLAEDCRAAAAIVIGALKNGNKVLTCGNGGSAADAQHFTAELVGRFRINRSGLAAISLTTDPSVVSSIGNDFGFEHVFSRQVEALGTAGDVLICLTTSGKSPNIIQAFAVASKLGMSTIILSGQEIGPGISGATLNIAVPCSETPRVQEVHMVVLHGVCAVVEGWISARE
jgi:D-sedoheptulose 7-phosphate isomerase